MKYFYSIVSILIFTILTMNYISIKYYENSVEHINLEKYKDSLYIDKYIDVYTPDIVYNLQSKYNSNYEVYIKRIITIAYKYTKKYNIDMIIYMGLLHTESRYDSMSLSNKDAYGIAQVTQVVVDYYNSSFDTFYKMEDLYNIEICIAISTWWLQMKLAESYNRYEIALAKYYAGGYWKTHGNKYVHNILNKRNIKY